MAKKKATLNEKIKPIPAATPETGIDTGKSIIDNIIKAAQVGALDTSAVEALSTSAQTREQTYELLDAMAQDDVIAAVLETYAEDTIQTNDKGQAVWIESSDSDVLNYTSWVLDSLNVEKHLYQWTYCLVTYGDCYVRLFRKSDVQDDLLFKHNKHNRQLNEATNGKEPMNEEAKLRVYADDDPYIPYVQLVDNPGEMFDLQKFGKTYGYIKAPVRMIQQQADELYKYITRYKMKQKDVEIFDATSFVHACLENTTQRQPESVDLYIESELKTKTGNPAFKDDDYSTDDDSMTSSYQVKRGQSLLYNSFKIWRELNLLEMSAMLNRLTKSAIVRILNIDVGDTPKSQVQNVVSRLKDKIEQKSAISDGGAMAQYNNPGPIDNIIYVPTNGTKGQISAQTIGGDFDPKSLVDLEYFRDKLFGSLKVPKQFFGFTEDGAGFNGGQSLTILSSRYGKTVKKIQAIMCQMITDIINLFLIDRGLDNYVNKFQVRMQTPVTQEEIDRRANTDNRIRFVSDFMGQLGDIKDETIKLKIEKSLLSGVVNDSEIIGLLTEYIDKIEAEEKAKAKNSETAGSEGGEETGLQLDIGDQELPEMPEEELPEPEETAQPLESVESLGGKERINEKEGEDYLPSPDDLGLDFTDK